MKLGPFEPKLNSELRIEPTGFSPVEVEPDLMESVSDLSLNVT